MTLSFGWDRVPIPRGRGRREIEGRKEFPGPIREGHVAINGFRVDFEPSDVDHKIDVLEIDVDRRIPTVNEPHIFGYKVEVDYRDKNFDDDYSGYVQVLIIVDLV